MTVITETIAVLSGGAAGAIAGTLTARRSQAKQMDRPDETRFEDFPEEQAWQMARQWRIANGMPPEAEKVILGKLRLGWGLRRQHHGRRRVWP
jgi:hypothetical protein